MNFGDILDDWEKKYSHSRSKKLEPGHYEKKYKKRKRTVESTCDITQIVKKSHEILEDWLLHNVVPDKDMLLAEHDKQCRLSDARQIHLVPADASVDLHGLSRDAAWRRLDMFVSDCICRGYTKILIIHGKGNHSGGDPVLADMVRSFIEYDSRLGKSGHPGIKDGGTGATWVLIKKRKNNKDK